MPLCVEEVIDLSVLGCSVPDFVQFWEGTDSFGRAADSFSGYALRKKRETERLQG
jgi:hypothetical protein